MSQNVLITGSNSGFGKLTTETLLKNGFSVAATMRDIRGRNKDVAATMESLGAHVVEMDVTVDESVIAGVDQATAKLGRIDVLINNAGIGVVGWQEAFDMDNFKKLFDLNVFGVQRMARAVLPDMRKRGQGTLIQISSLLGRFVLPFFGPYNATKHAVEALADNYRVELSQFGIESLIVEPGGFGTTFNTNLMSANDRQRAATYGEAAGAPEQQMANFEKNYESENAPDPQMVADAILNLLQTPFGSRPFRTVVDGMGMGAPIENINAASQQAMQGIYGAFGMDNLLQVKAG